MGAVRAKQRAFSLLELLVFIAICSVVAALVMALWLDTTRSTADLADETALAARIDLALERLGRDVRAASSVELTSAGGRQTLVLRHADGPAVAWLWTSAAEDEAEDGRFCRTVAGGEMQEIVLRGLESAKFRLLAPDGGRKTSAGVEVMLQPVARAERTDPRVLPPGEIRTAFHVRCQEAP